MRTKDITNITQFRGHLREHLIQVQRTGRPLFITGKSGSAEAVILSPETYDQMMEQLDIAHSLAMADQSMKEIKAGRGKTLGKAIRNVADQLGLEIRR